MTDSDLAFASIEQIGRLFRKRKLSPVELTRFMLARIEQLNAKLNAYLTVTAELALAQAKKAEAELFAPRGGKSRRDRGPLHGIPISLKDNIYTKDVRTTPPLSPSSKRPALLFSAKPTCTSLPTASPPTTRTLAPRAIPGIFPVFREARAEVPRLPLQPGCATAALARIRADRSAFPRRFAASSD